MAINGAYDILLQTVVASSKDLTAMRACVRPVSMVSLASTILTIV